MEVHQIVRILIILYWIFFAVSIIGLAIDYGIKLKNNEDGGEGKDKINKNFRSKLFGLGILLVIGIILSPILLSRF